MTMIYFDNTLPSSTVGAANTAVNAIRISVNRIYLAAGRTGSTAQSMEQYPGCKKTEMINIEIDHEIVKEEKRH